MKIEHIGLNVKEPLAMADWYVRNLGMKVIRKGNPPGHAHFLADSSGQVMLEIYRNASAPLPDYASMDLLVFHVAFLADDVPAAYQRLLEAGASPLTPPAVVASGDHIAAVRDPWGMAVQLVRRKAPMIG